MDSRNRQFLQDIVNTLSAMADSETDEDVRVELTIAVEHLLDAIDMIRLETFGAKAKG